MLQLRTSQDAVNASGQTMASNTFAFCVMLGVMA